MADQAMDSARKAEIEISNEGYLGSLHGVPVAVKDLCWVDRLDGQEDLSQVAKELRLGDGVPREQVLEGCTLDKLEDESDRPLTSREFAYPNYNTKISDNFLTTWGRPLKKKLNLLDTSRTWDLRFCVDISTRRARINFQIAEIPKKILSA